MPDVHAFRLHAQAPLPEADLRLDAASVPRPGAGQVLLEVEACGVCRTDLHITVGDIPPHRLPVTLGHQVVGRVVEVGPPGELGSPGSASPSPSAPLPPPPALTVGTRVGVGWLAWSCGSCPDCQAGRENLCPSAKFTGYDVDGGYAGLMLADAGFVYPLPPALSDPVAVAPLLCGGIIGYRALRLAGVVGGSPGRLLLIGFGNSASITLQAARALGWECLVATRSELHQEVARSLGAAWAGRDPEPESVDAAVIFAPAGGLVPVALGSLRRGGTVACAGITMTDIPGFPYSLLYWERTVRSVANATRQDARELLDLAANAGIRTEVELFELAETRAALARVAASDLRASAVVDLRQRPSS